MVHNGIEYADMQMIAEIYGILRDGHGLDAGAIGDVLACWNEGVLARYLIEIAGKVAHARDVATGDPLLYVIVDAAGQKGTGRWTAIESQHLRTPIPAIEAAVVARNVSARLEERAAGEALFGAASQAVKIDLDLLESALIAGKVICYAQGFVMIDATCEAMGWEVDLPEVARTWRAGCIIRSAMLDDMASALGDAPGENLMRTPFFADPLMTHHGALRAVVARAVEAGHPVRALASGVAYFDAMRAARGTANMMQAQRDFFGLHGFVHVNGEADEHGPWAHE